ncbi:unnamed protein product [Cladocopium goreaui]|uniref:Uncharacterized protein n=1 Tax=Cladocopium goreaui TaxID=2562237 RepID=A0A9P1CFD2_9DINO|nr:unnamed protein product [Cladocopium goreaui]
MGVETKQPAEQSSKVEKRSKTKRKRDRQIFLAICCQVPGEAMASSTGICVHEKEILRDVLNVWARGVLQGRSLPSEARVLSNMRGKDLPLDVRKPLQLLRRSLPVRKGHYTVTVIMPKEALRPVAEPSPKLKAKDAKGPRSSTAEKPKASVKKDAKLKAKNKDSKEKDGQKATAERTENNSGQEPRLRSASASMATWP